jgi:large subunit ribosomal protein L4
MSAHDSDRAPVAGSVEVPYHDPDGTLAGTIAVDAETLGGRLRRRLMFEAVLRFEANQRRGTHKTRGRSQVAGSTRKMYRQKGTGNARMGSRKAPHRRGGGVSMGPQPRSYRLGMPRKSRRLARNSALLSKLLDREAAVVERIDLDRPSTRTLAKLLEATDIGENALVVVTAEERNRNLLLSVRNFRRVTLLPVQEISAYHLLFHARLLMSRAALAELVGDVRVSRSA